MSKTITVSAIIYNAKYDQNPEPEFMELTTLDFDEWLKEENKTRIEDNCATYDADEFDVHEKTFEVNGEGIGNKGQLKK